MNDPVSTRPAVCETTPTSKMPNRRVGSPPKKSAIPHESGENSASPRAPMRPGQTSGSDDPHAVLPHLLDAVLQGLERERVAVDHDDLRDFARLGGAGLC